MLYLEGGSHLRAPMSQFIRRATGPIDLNIQPCKSGSDAIKRCASDTDALLLIDSEGELTPQLVQDVTSQIGAANRAFFMVQFMESWFLADRNTLAEYFGTGFRPNALPQNPNIEAISKQDVENGLRDATRNCAKRRYLKVRDDARLLGLINPSAVYHACPNFAALIDFLRSDAAG